MSARKCEYMRCFLVIMLSSFSAGLLVSCVRPSPQTSEVATPSQVSIKLESKTGWEGLWERTVKEAKKEGTVVVYGPPIPQARQGFTESFQKAYPGITLEYLSLSSAETPPKIMAERRAGVYLVDLYIGGTITVLTTPLKQFALPIKPFLILPEVKNPESWLENKLDFADTAGEISLVFTINTNSRLVYNSEQVRPSEIASWWDLTKPKWKGKIIMRDPRIEGTGNANVFFWYIHPELGLDYINAFAANKPILTRDPRFQTESVARGKYSMLVGPRSAEVIEFQKLGMPLVWSDVLKEGTYSSSANGSVTLLDKSPHPNAATVFLNWLLGKEGQTIWTITSGYASRRLDAPAEHLIEAERPKPGVSYMNTYKEEMMQQKVEMMDLAQKIFVGF